jgi:hypothetical protein
LYTNPSIIFENIINTNGNITPFAIAPIEPIIIIILSTGVANLNFYKGEFIFKNKRIIIKE